MYVLKINLPIAAVAYYALLIVARIKRPIDVALVMADVDSDDLAISGNCCLIHFGLYLAAVNQKDQD